MKSFKFLLTFSFWVLLISFNVNGQDEKTPETQAKASTNSLVKITKIDSLTAKKVYVCYLEFYKEKGELDKLRDGSKEASKKIKEKAVQIGNKLENHLKEVLTEKQYREYHDTMESCVTSMPVSTTSK